MTDTGALLSQLERLHTEVYQIAKDMAILYNTEKSIDQKATVIGRAMVKQKETTEVIQTQQQKMEEHMTGYQEYTNQKQDVIKQFVEDVMVAVSQMRNVEEREDILLKSLNRLNKNQTAFMKANAAFTKAAEDDLDTVKVAINEIKRTLSGMNVVEQTALMAKKADEIQTSLDSYVATRMKIAALMQDKTEETQGKILEMQKQMEIQKTSVEEIMRVSKSCEEKTVAMCEKLEKLIGDEKPEENEVDVSLEDMFGIPEPEEFFDETDKTESETIDWDNEEDVFSNSFDLIEQEEDSSDESGEDSEKESQENESNLEETMGETQYDPENDPDIRFIETEQKVKKKGFFARLFGGR